MNDVQSQSARLEGVGAPASVVGGIRLAASFLTILPVAPRGTAPVEAIGAALRYFPLVGFIIGLGLALCDRALGWFASSGLRSVLIVMVWVIVTGAVHLDGVADTADALGAGWDRGRALEILRDSRIGSFGAIAVFFVLALKCVSIGGLKGASRPAALCLAPVWGRWAMVAVAYKLKYLRASGAGSSLLAGDGQREMMVASILAILSLAPFVSLPTLVAAGMAVALVITMRALYQRWLGGMTGDLLGAAGEIVELAVLIVMSV